MPTYQFEAMDATGQEIKDVIEAATEEEAQATIRQMGYFVTKITVKKARKAAADKRRAGKAGKGFSIGRVNVKTLTTFTRQLSILQDAGLPILRSLKILENQAKPALLGSLKNCLIDTIEEIEGGSTLSEAMAKAPKGFDRLYVNMIKAGEAGGALEVILQILRRLAEFQEASVRLRRRVRGALVYPICVITFAVLILVFILWKIVPQFEKIFKDFDTELPVMTQILVMASNIVMRYWYLLPLIPVGEWLYFKLVKSFEGGKYTIDLFKISMPIFGSLVQKNIVARTTRTLGTLVASGVPILEALHITRETAGNSIFERLYAKVHESIREGESIAQPMKASSNLSFDPMTMLAWVGILGAGLGVPVGILWFIGKVEAVRPVVTAEAMTTGATPTVNLGAVDYLIFFVTAMLFSLVGAAVIMALFYLLKMNHRILDDLVINMVDVGEETGELDTMLYKVADYFDDEVKVATETLTSLMEPLLIIVLGVMIGFIVIALFLPLITLITKLT